MGGLGSGRRRYSSRSGRRTAGESLPLDVREIYRAGHLVPGTYESLHWYRRGHGESMEAAKKRGAGISYFAQEDGVTLRYVYRGDKVSQTVRVEWTKCHYGGGRAWWRCPNCSRRVAVLYAPGKFFACRHCYGLCYDSQREARDARGMRAARKIRERLGQDDGGHLQAPPDKPKGMHWRTYVDLVERCDARERESWSGMMAELTTRFNSMLNE